MSRKLFQVVLIPFGLPGKGIWVSVSIYGRQSCRVSLLDQSSKPTGFESAEKYHTLSVSTSWLTRSSLLVVRRRTHDASCSTVAWAGLLHTRSCSTQCEFLFSQKLKIWWHWLCLEVSKSRTKVWLAVGIGESIRPLPDFHLRCPSAVVLCINKLQIHFLCGSRAVVRGSRRLQQEFGKTIFFCSPHSLSWPFQGVLHTQFGSSCGWYYGNEKRKFLSCDGPSFR